MNARTQVDVTATDKGSLPALAHEELRTLYGLRELGRLSASTSFHLLRSALAASLTVTATKAPDCGPGRS